MTTFSFLFICLLAGCKKGGKSCPSNTYTYHFINNAKVDTTTHGGVFPLAAFTAAGSKRVFKYTHIHAECAGIIDGIGVYTLLFEADPLVATFKLDGPDLKKANCYFRTQTGEGSSPGDYTPIAGTIDASRINGQNWKIQINLVLNNNIPFSVSGVFTPE